MNTRRKLLPLIACLVVVGIVGGFVLLRGSKAATPIYGDITADSQVNVIDLSILLSHYGLAATFAQGDLNSSGKVDQADLTILTSQYGKLDPVPGTPLPTGQFTTVGSKIYDPAGKEFIPAGANFSGPNYSFDKKTLNYDLATLKDKWKINTLRLNTCMAGGCDASKAAGNTYTGNNDLDAIVKKYTDAKMVVLIDFHQIPSGYFPDMSGMTDFASVRAWWVATASKYKDNPYVWFDLFCEPGNPNNTNQGGPNGPISSKWRDMNRQLVGAVRGTGANNMIVVKGTYYGQESGSDNSNKTQPLATSQSAVLTYGKEVAAGYKNITFGFHTYGGWGSAAATDAQLDARMADYMSRVQALGYPLLVGETGSQNYLDQDAAVARIDKQLADGANTLTTAQKDSLNTLRRKIISESRATRATYRVAPTKGVGIIAWTSGINKWNDYGLLTATPETVGKTYWGDEFNMDKLTYDAAGNPTNLNWHGKLLWGFTHRTY